MKKIFYILVSAIVALGAVACNNEIDENIEANRSEGVSFTASLDETASRILVGDLNESGKHPITFESDDVIYATYFGEGGIVAPFAFTTTDGVTFTCLENNADGLAPQTLIGQSVEFSVNELDSSKGVDGIVLYASQSFENKSTVTLGLANYCGVFAFTSSHDVTLTASSGIFSWKIDEDDYQTGPEITIPAAEGIQYVPFIPQNEAITLSYSIDDEKVKEITRVFSNKIYTLGGLNEAVASVNGVNYTDLNQAVAAAVAAGQDVVLAADATVTEPILVPEGAEVTIDLNGMELSADNTTYAINNLGTLTLKDSNAGAIPSSSSVMAKTSAEIDWSVSARGIYNGYDKDGNHVTTAKLIIESGNYQATGTNGGAAVFNYGILEVKGGYFQSNGGYGLNNQETGVMTIENAKVEGGIYNMGTLTVKDTELLQHLSGKHAIYNWKGSVTIDGGEFDSLSGNELILADGDNATVTINNGTFKKTAKSWLFGAATGKNISFVINDGTFYGYVNEPEMTVDTIRPYGDPIVVKGGSFNFDPTNWLAEGYKATLNGELYEVSEYVPAASVGGEEYETIEEAIAAAKEIGGEVTVSVVAGTYDSFPADKLAEGVTLECAEGTVFEGSSSLNIGGATVKGATFSNDGGNAVGGTVNGDFEDCVFTGTNGHRYCYLPEDGEITYTNCVFEGSTYGVHFDGGGEGSKLIFRDCEFYGFNALPGTIDVEFYGCFFGHKEGGSGYNGINLWGNTYMEDTQFDWTADGVTEFCDPVQATPTYVFKNVTVNKTGAYEPIQFSDMYQPEGVVVTIDGVVYANVATDEQLAAAIAMDVKDLNIYLAADNLNFAGSNSNAMGGASTESVTINGNGKKLTMTSTYMPAFRLQNGGGKVAISDMTINGTMTSGTWNIYDILFYNNSTISNVTFNNAIALDGIDNGTTFDLTDVTINETKGDFYALWICANGAKVTIDGLNITTDVAASKGRGIKIDDQYMNENVEKVTLDINDATFVTANKGAIMVKSTKGADITASNLNIAGVVADNEFAVWVDEDGADHYDLVTVSGCTKWLEGAPTTYKVSALNDLGWTNVYAYVFDKATGTAIGTAWPGKKITTTEIVDGRTYSYVEIGKKYFDKEVGVVFNDGASSASQTADKVFDLYTQADYYVRLSAQGAIDINPMDVNTFKYSIYVWNQKNTSTKPNIFAFDKDNGEAAVFSGWPGKQLTNTCTYKHKGGDRKYYYVEIPTTVYGHNIGVIASNNGGNQTADLVQVANRDMYVGFWYDSSSSYGFWGNGSATFSNPNFN